MKKLSILAILVAATLFFSMPALAESVTWEVVGNDVVIKATATEVEEHTNEPKFRGTSTGWGEENDQPMVKEGAFYVYKDLNGKGYYDGGNAEFCIVLGNNKYLPEQASDFMALKASGIAVPNLAGNGSNYKMKKK